MRTHLLLAAALVVATGCRSPRPAAVEDAPAAVAGAKDGQAGGGEVATAGDPRPASLPSGARPKQPATTAAAGPGAAAESRGLAASPPVGPGPKQPPVATATPTGTPPRPQSAKPGEPKPGEPRKDPTPATPAEPAPPGKATAAAKEADAGAAAAEPARPRGQNVIPDDLIAETAQPKAAKGEPDGGTGPRKTDPPATAPGETVLAAGTPSPEDRPARRGRPSEPESEPAGGLPIPGAEITFHASRVRRFLESGGSSLDGRVVDADTGKAVDAADIEAFMGTRSVEGETDPQGRFRFEGLIPGSRLTLWITSSPTYVQERTEVVVPENQPSFQGTFRLLNRDALTGAVDGGAGMFLSRRGSRTVVTGLAAFGPAERAGVKVGDAIVAVGKRKVGDLGPGAIDYLLRGTIGSELELTVQTASAPPRKLTMMRSAR